MREVDLSDKISLRFFTRAELSSVVGKRYVGAVPAWFRVESCQIRSAYFSRCPFSPALLFDIVVSL